MTKKEMRKELFIARRIIDAIDNFDELKLVYVFKIKGFKRKEAIVWQR